MRLSLFICAVCGLIAVLCPPAFGQGIPADDPVRVLVGRLDLERYKATIKGLTEFGDRRQGTDRNRAAVDWIERQLKSFGCNTGRIKYEYNAPQPQWRPQSRVPIPVAGGEIRAGHGNGHAALRSPLRLWRVVLVLDAPGVAAEALQLAFDPVDRCAIAIGPLPPIAEFGQALDRGLVPLQIEPSDQDPDRVVGRTA